MPPFTGTATQSSQLLRLHLLQAEFNRRLASSRSSKRTRRSKSSRVGRMAMSRRFAKKAFGKSLGVSDINPFPTTWRTKLTWHPPCVNVAGTASAVYQIKLNDCFDPDGTGTFGNGQPLYFDEICSTTGPYKSFIVHGWKARIDVNNSTGSGDTVPYQTLCDALEVIVQQGYEINTEGDTNAELQSAPNREVALLSPALEAPHNRHTFYLNGKTMDYTTKPAFDSTLAGNFTGSPSTVIFGNIGLRSIVGDNYSAYMMVHVEFDVEFYDIDGAAS